MLLQRVASSSAAVQSDNSEDALWDWLTTSTATTTATKTSTIATTTSTATQTYTISTTTSMATQTSAPETFQQWRGIQGKYPLELHKLQHIIQRTPDQFRDPRQPLPTGTQTSVLEQLRKRIKIITDDMTCEAVAWRWQLPKDEWFSFRPPKRSAPKRRRKPAHRRRKRDEKRACSDATEESISSTLPQTKRVRTLKGLPSNLFSHVTLTDSGHFHIVASYNNNTTLPSATFRQPDNSSHCTPPHARVSTNLCVTHSLWLKSSLAWSGNQRHGGYAGIRVGEAVNPGPATHERDWTDEQPDPTHRRINEAGDSIPSSQESVTRVSRICETLGSFHGLTSPASARSGKPPETATAETTAQRVPSMRTVRLRPSCSRCLL